MLLMNIEKSEMPKLLEGIFSDREQQRVFFEGKRYGTLMEFLIGTTCKVSKS